MAAARAYYYYSWDSPHAKEAFSLPFYCLPLQLETLNLENLAANAFKKMK
jgi:hypothetical protein